jgi:hypothetical protein
MLELRHFPATDSAQAVTDAAWTRLEGQTLTSATYLQAEDDQRVENASASFVDAAHPEKVHAVGWSAGFGSADVPSVSDWHLLP